MWKKMVYSSWKPPQRLPKMWTNYSLKLVLIYFEFSLSSKKLFWLIFGVEPESFSHLISLLQPNGYPKVLDHNRRTQSNLRPQIPRLLRRRKILAAADEEESPLGWRGRWSWRDGWWKEVCVGPLRVTFLFSSRSPVIVHMYSFISLFLTFFEWFVRVCCFFEKRLLCLFVSKMNYCENPQWFFLFYKYKRVGSWKKSLWLAILLLGLVHLLNLFLLLFLLFIPLKRPNPTNRRDRP
jgi:hypothetical protein